MAKALIPSATTDAVPRSSVEKEPVRAEKSGMRRFAALLSFSVALAVFQPTDDAAAAVQTFRASADTYVDAGPSE